LDVSSCENLAGLIEMYVFIDSNPTILEEINLSVPVSKGWIPVRQAVTVDISENGGLQFVMVESVMRSRNFGSQNIVTPPTITDEPSSRYALNYTVGTP
jgi:hypothetical protein